MSEYYPKIEVKNVSVINICFRSKGTFVNEGRIVLDIDTYNFVGHLTDDVIVGYYGGGMYQIYYFYKEYQMKFDPETQLIIAVSDVYQEYQYEMFMRFRKNNLKSDFSNTVICDLDYSITFEKIEDDLDIIRRTIEENSDLLIGKE